MTAAPTLPRESKPPVIIEPLAVLLDDRGAVLGGYVVRRGDVLAGVFPADTHPEFAEYELGTAATAEAHALRFAESIQA